MKRVFLTLIVVLLFATTAAAFEREAPVLPTISEPLAVLESATGWMRLPRGEWVSRENRIPNYLSSEFEYLQDSREYALGVDNFGWLQLREMEFGGKAYYLLLKQYRTGNFRYPNIMEGWYYSYRLKGYLIEKDAFPPPISLEDRKAALVEIPVMAQFDLSYQSDRYLEDIAAKIAEGQGEGDTYQLLVNMIKIGDVARFVTLERQEQYLSVAGITVATYKGISEYERLPIEFEEVFTEEVFRNFYYELDYESFAGFWNGWRSE